MDQNIYFPSQSDYGVSVPRRLPKMRAGRLDGNGAPITPAGIGNPTIPYVDPFGYPRVEEVKRVTPVLAQAIKGEYFKFFETPLDEIWFIYAWSTSFVIAAGSTNFHAPCYVPKSKGINTPSIPDAVSPTIATRGYGLFPSGSGEIVNNDGAAGHKRAGTNYVIPLQLPPDTWIGILITRDWTAATMEIVFALWLSKVKVEAV